MSARQKGLRLGYYYSHHQQQHHDDGCKKNYRESAPAFGFLGRSSPHASRSRRRGREGGRLRPSALCVAAYVVSAATFVGTCCVPYALFHSSHSSMDRGQKDSGVVVMVEAQLYQGDRQRQHVVEQLQHELSEKISSATRGDGEGRGGGGGETAKEATSTAVATHVDLEAPARGALEEENAQQAIGAFLRTEQRFAADDAEVVLKEVQRYVSKAKLTLEEDARRVAQGLPVQGRYLVLSGIKNELVNRLRAVISGFFLGMMTDRVLLGDITYQKDNTKGLLSQLFETPGYDWDLSLLSPALRKAVEGAQGPKLAFDMRSDHFEQWMCEGVGEGSAPVIKMTTMLYPFPLLIRNASFKASKLYQHFRLDDEKYGKHEALETLFVRRILRPQPELRDQARGVIKDLRTQARTFQKDKGLAEPPRVAGLHVRTFYVEAMSSSSSSKGKGGNAGADHNVKLFEHCAHRSLQAQTLPQAAQRRGHAGPDPGVEHTQLFVATDTAASQSLAKKLWGGRASFIPFGQPGRFLGGIKTALVDLLVVGSLDAYVMTPHSSFSELASVLSFTWEEEQPSGEGGAAPHPRNKAITSSVHPYYSGYTIMPNKPVLPVFEGMNDLEHKKLAALLDRRGGVLETSEGTCMEQKGAGLSVMIAVGGKLSSMAEEENRAKCH